MTHLMDVHLSTTHRCAVLGREEASRRYRVHELVADRKFNHSYLYSNENKVQCKEREKKIKAGKSESGGREGGRKKED